MISVYYAFRFCSVELSCTNINAVYPIVRSFSDTSATITNYETIEVFKGNKIPDISLVKCILETGRTHQIRVHMSHKGNPIIGDQTYGKKIKKIRGVDEEFDKILKSLERQALHAHTLGFIHPTTNKEVFFASELPDDLLKLQKMLKKLKN